MSNPKNLVLLWVLVVLLFSFTLCSQPSEDKQTQEKKEVLEQLSENENVLQQEIDHPGFLDKFLRVANTLFSENMMNKIQELELHLQNAPEDASKRVELIEKYDQGLMLMDTPSSSSEPKNQTVLPLIKERLFFHIHELLKQTPENSDAKYSLVYLTKAQQNEIKKLLEQKLDANPQEPGIYQNLLMLSDPKMDSQYEAYLKKIIELDPDNEQFHSLYASFLLSNQQYTDAITHQKAAIDLSSGFSVVSGMVRLAYLYYKIQNYEEADRYATQALDAAQHPTDDVFPSMYNNIIHEANTVKGLLALKQGTMEEALQFAEASFSMQTSPQLSSGAINFELAEQLYLAGLQTEAENFVQMGLRLLMPGDHSDLLSHFETRYPAIKHAFK